MWHMSKSYLLCKNVAEVLPDIKWNPYCRCRDLLGIGDRWHDDIRTRCSQNHSCNALSSEIIDVKDGTDVYSTFWRLDTYEAIMVN